jgi:hypothetical protein
MCVPRRELDVNLSAGTQLGPYRIETLLGAGGMGEVSRVFRAKQFRPPHPHNSLCADSSIVLACGWRGFFM